MGTMEASGHIKYGGKRTIIYTKTCSKILLPLIPSKGYSLSKTREYPTDTALITTCYKTYMGKGE